MQAQLLNNLRDTVSNGRLEKTELPLCPEVCLYLLTADYPMSQYLLTMNCGRREQQPPFQTWMNSASSHWLSDKLTSDSYKVGLDVRKMTNAKIIARQEIRNKHQTYS